MPDYTYQHDIFFQYTFGSTAMLLYLTIANLADLKLRVRSLPLLLAALSISVFCFSSTVLPKALFYPSQAIRHWNEYKEIRDILSDIPESASVTATTFYTTALSLR